MKQVITRLIKVKSIITILMTIAFMFLLFTKQPIPQEFIMIYTTIIAFYFGTQTGKEQAANESKSDIGSDID